VFGVVGWGFLITCKVTKKDSHIQMKMWFILKKNILFFMGGGTEGRWQFSDELKDTCVLQRYSATVQNPKGEKVKNEPYIYIYINIKFFLGLNDHKI
jgi:hypothetical protein